MIPLELPYPAKILWPNGRGHHMAKHRANVKHKAWAHFAMAEAGRSIIVGLAAAPTLRLVATFHPKTRHAVDRDNASASLKAYQDGIAAALGVDDSRFLEPSIHFGAPIKGGRVYLSVEAL